MNTLGSAALGLLALWICETIAFLLSYRRVNGDAA